MVTDKVREDMMRRVHICDKQNRERQGGDVFVLKRERDQNKKEEKRARAKRRGADSRVR